MPSVAKDWYRCLGVEQGVGAFAQVADMLGLLQAHQAQLQEMADSTNAQVAAWQEQRFQGECSAVAALHQLASQAVMNATTLPFTLRLEVPH